MDQEIANIPPPDHKRIVIIGAGFAGLRLARELTGSPYQVILVDKNNFHQFQPLLYQVAMAGLEANAVAFPLRNVFQEKNSVRFRMAELLEVDYEQKRIKTNIGRLDYDHLVLATGTTTNYFGIDSVRKNSISMKTLPDSIFLRNSILNNFEKALNVTDESELGSLMNIVVAGGGATGVELAGALAEMKKYILPKDFPELDFDMMHIYLFEGLDDLLSGMSKNASANARKYLEKLGVIVKTGTFVEDFTDHTIKLSNGDKVHSHTLIWAAGVEAKKIPGLPDKVYGKNNRIRTDAYNKARGLEDIYVLGDSSMMETDDFPEGHPQLAQPAIQQAENLAANFKRKLSGKTWISFRYKDKGTLATVGRHLAVADLPSFKLKGYPAWVLWSIVHLFSIIGTRNKMIIFLNWVWNYFNYNQAIGLIIKPKKQD